MDSGGAVILVAIGDDLLRREVTAWLREEGCAVVPVASGLEAIDAARTHTPSLAVLTLELPWLDGAQVARAFRRDRALEGLAVLEIAKGSGWPFNQPGIDASDDSLTMPLSRETLVRCVERLLAHASSMTRIKTAARVVPEWLQFGRRRG